MIRALLLALSLWAYGLLALAAPGEALFGRTLSEVRLSGLQDAERYREHLPLAPGDLLTRDKVQESIRALDALGVFARVALAAEADGDKARLLVLVEPIRRVTRLQLVGARSLEEKRLLRAAELPAGTPFSPATLDAAARRIATEYFTEGWRETVVRWDALPLGDTEVVIDFSISEGDPTTLVRLEFEGDVALAQGALHAAFDLVPGDRLSLVRLAAGLEELRARYRQHAFYNAKVGLPKIDVADGRGVIGLRIEAGPRFHLQVRGQRAFDAETLLSYAGYRGERPLDAPTLRELAARIQDFYMLAGYPHAQVEARESSPPERPALPDPVSRRQENSDALWGKVLEPSPLSPPVGPAERIVTFFVREGTPVRVVSRQFEGVTRFTTSELEQRIDLVLRDARPPQLAAGRDRARLKAAWISGSPGEEPQSERMVTPESVFATSAYREALAQITDLYRSQGHLDVRVGPARLVPITPDTARVLIPVVEGPQTRVSEVSLSGESAFTERQLREVLTFAANDPLSYFAVEESRLAIALLYQSAGHLYAVIEDDIEIDEATAQAKVVFRIDEGPAVRVSRLELRGLSRTDPELVRESLQLSEGMLITPDALVTSLRSLMELGLFSSANVEPQDSEKPAAQKPLLVSLREKPSRSLELRVGGSLADGPRASLTGLVGNIGGRNESFLGSLKLNWPFPRVCAQEPESCSTAALPKVPWERRVNLSLVLPSYSGFRIVPADMRLDAVHENLLRPAFHLTRYAGVVSFDNLVQRRLFSGELSAMVQLELEADDFRRRGSGSTAIVQTLADLRAQRLPVGSILLVSLRPTLTLDLRDDKANPSAGLLASVSLDASQSLAASLSDSADHIRLLRALVAASGWIPVHRARRVVVQLSGRFGSILKADDSVVIGTKRFFLGGTQTLRGFNEDNVVPQDVREELHDAVGRCRSLMSGLGCSGQVRELIGGSTITSEGGEVLVAGRAELRFGLTGSLDGALFADAGNLWLDPSRLNLLDLRTATGLGLRMSTPIGPASVDLGWNIDRDQAVNEPLVRLHFSVGTF